MAIGDKLYDKIFIQKGVAITATPFLNSSIELAAERAATAGIGVVVPAPFGWGGGGTASAA